MAKLGKILVVEDDPHARQGLSDLLSAWGYETDTAGDGAEALEKIAGFQSRRRHFRSSHAASDRHGTAAPTP